MVHLYLLFGVQLTWGLPGSSMLPSSPWPTWIQWWSPSGTELRSYYWEPGTTPRQSVEICHVQHMIVCSYVCMYICVLFSMYCTYIRMCTVWCVCTCVRMCTVWCVCMYVCVPLSGSSPALPISWGLQPHR